jgi:ADP-ribosylation factor-like protein 8
MDASKAIFMDSSSVWKKEIEISIVGLQNAGKSTLVNSIATGKLDKETVPTIGMNYRNVKKGNVNLKLWDL